MSKSIENIRLLLEEITMQCDANWIAFSGGLDSSILAQIKKKSDLNAVTIITKDFVGTGRSKRIAEQEAAKKLLNYSTDPAPSWGP